MLERHPCQICGLNPLGIFFPYSQIRYATNMGLTGNQLTLKCLACHLITVLDSERDHYKLTKRGIIKDWLSTPSDETGEPEWNTNNLSKALSDFHDRRIAYHAYKLDKTRNREMDMRGPNPLDREHDEVQIPLTRQELTRLGMKNRSPTVDSKDPVFNEWNAIDMSRKWAHGHGDPI